MNIRYIKIDRNIIHFLFSNIYLVIIDINISITKKNNNITVYKIPIVYKSTYYNGVFFTIQELLLKYVS